MRKKETKTVNINFSIEAPKSSADLCLPLTGPSAGANKE